MKIKKYLQFINENSQSDSDEKIIFHLKSDLVNMLEKLTGYKLADLYLNLINGIEKKYLVEEPIDYLNIDNEGNISFLKSRYFSEDDKWESSRRQKLNIKKAIKDIYKESYLNEVLKQTDIELFVNKLNAILNPSDVVEFRGEEMLRAFNYTGELDPRTLDNSCANFIRDDRGSVISPDKKRYDIYTKNPENIGVVVVFEDGVIKGRRTFQQGIQTVDSGEFKKGQFYTVWGNYYGAGGSGGKYDAMIRDYLKKKYDAIPMMSGSGTFRIKIKETRFPYYCAFDTMYVNFSTGEIADRCSGYGWERTYGAKCPQSILKQKKEEDEKEKDDDIIMHVSDPETLR